ncbi:MAG: maleylpyruvate isomerase family mycothiol-dependent enzyme [Ilumatobacter sp.]|uniref:maleylpyruvate isomerase family mycothiol-dependent enzyme n=1 Tax=Ilumatobacter sp. TaxID=1967498 RepID=UPI00260A4D1D|nr:maleylpyruvate isomerase family mycothiol-dependent enzyme [Ilumatobacter sp.]MDJ0768364.1 maleylpyruvate isomerase family mycothiol-dependent enzyme [Ilumatobacter sp.]
MPSEIDQQRTIDGLRAVWASVDALVADLADDQWRVASPLPGWDVQANLAHMVGTESFLLGREPETGGEPAADHVRNPIGEMNERWIETFASRTPAEVLAAFRDVTAQRLAVLDAMPADEWNAVGFTPAGEDVYGRFMQIRVFDCWMHEQDIRAAVGRPGHDGGIAVEVSLDEMTTAMGFVVGKRAGAPDGASVTFELTGGSPRSIHVRVEGRAAVVPELDGPATVTLTMPIVSFGRIAGGRLDAADHLPNATIIGDEALGRRILDNLSYTI